MEATELTSERVPSSSAASSSSTLSAHEHAVTIKEHTRGESVQLLRGIDAVFSLPVPPLQQPPELNTPLPPADRGAQRLAPECVIFLLT